MPYLYLTAEQVETVRRLAWEQPTSPEELQRVRARVTDQTERRHRVVREIIYEGTEATLREQLSRSMADGVRAPGLVQITVRTLSNSLPEVEPSDV